MKKAMDGLVLAVAVLLLFPGQGRGEGFGFYGWGRGWPSIGVPGALEDLLPEFRGLEIDLRHDHFTLGYLYDGASTAEDRFGWRLNAGLDIVLTNFEGTNRPGGLGFGLDALSSDVYDALGFGFAAKGAYGVGILRTERLRLWAGPSMRLNANYVDPKSASIAEGSDRVEMDPRGVILSVGGGLEGGVRYRVRPDLALDVSTGFHYNFFGFYQHVDLTVDSQPFGSEESFFTGEEPFVFVQFALGFDFGGGDEKAP